MLVATGSIWKYLDNGSDQGVAWRAANFNDGSWASGHAPLGYGDANGIFPATTNSFGSDPNNKFITTYYRHAFFVSDASSVLGLRANLDRDDGAVLYLNSNEVFRSNMSNGPVTYLTLASNVVGGVDESTFFPYDVAPSALVNGSNFLAVEIHQANVTSSDIFFDLDLVATQTVFAPWIVSQPADQRSPLNSNVTFSVTARGTAALGYQWSANSASLPGANNSSLILTNVQRAAAGNYAVIVSNLAGVVTSTIASLVITAPTLDPIASQAGPEGSLLTFTATATDPDLPTQTLTFTLDAGAPAGATIDPVTGIFSWIPTEAQGPFTNSVTVRVTDNGAPPQSDSRTITIRITEVNAAPTLAAIPNQTVNEATLLTFTAGWSPSCCWWLPPRCRAWPSPPVPRPGRPGRATTRR